MIQVQALLNKVFQQNFCFFFGCSLLPFELCYVCIITSCSVKSALTNLRVFLYSRTDFLNWNRDPTKLLQPSFAYKEFSLRSLSFLQQNPPAAASRTTLARVTHDHWHWCVHAWVELFWPWRKKKKTYPHYLFSRDLRHQCFFFCCCQSYYMTYCMYFNSKCRSIHTYL